MLEADPDDLLDFFEDFSDLCDVSDFCDVSDLCDVSDFCDVSDLCDVSFEGAVGLVKALLMTLRVIFSPYDQSLIKKVSFHFAGNPWLHFVVAPIILYEF